MQNLQKMNEWENVRNLPYPIMDALKLWMETEGIKYSPNSLTGKAITYAYTRWENMMRYLQDGRIHIDNNLAENAIRPITLGRKELPVLWRPSGGSQHECRLFVAGNVQSA